MTDPTLPSRERARELADCHDSFDASDDEEKAILSAYASGALVPAGEVTAMRERAAAICDDEAGEKPSPYYETSRAQEALEAAAARIRALPLEVPHD